MFYINKNRIIVVPEVTLNNSIYNVNIIPQINYISRLNRSIFAVEFVKTSILLASLTTF